MTIEAKVRNTPSMHDKIPQVVVPKLKAMQLSPGGERVEVEEKVFPCYVMVQMILNEETWEFVRSTAYVVQFVGRDRARRGRMGAVMGGRGLVQPQPLSPSEVQRIFHQIQAGSSMMSEELAIQAGDHVRVQRGNLAGHEGVVASVSPVRGKLTVNLRWLNRDVPTEFRFDEVIKIKRKPIDLPPPPSQESTASTVPESGGAAAVRSSRRIPPEERLLALEALSRLDYDWRMLVAMERLDRVPMQALRQYCRAYGLGASGRKVALIERVREHIIETIRLEEEAANSESTTDDAQDTTAE
jgi:transcriptional antiterminator NusG